MLFIHPAVAIRPQSVRIEDVNRTFDTADDCTPTIRIDNPPTRTRLQVLADLLHVRAS